jgi:hypothetical protein
VQQVVAGKHIRHYLGFREMTDSISGLAEYGEASISGLAEYGEADVSLAGRSTLLGFVSCRCSFSSHLLFVLSGSALM